MPRDPDVPRLPRGRGVSLTGPQVFKILFFAMLLVAVIALQRPCSEAAGKFIGQFDQAPRDAAPAVQEPALPPGHYVEIKPGMTDEEIRRAIDSVGGGTGSGSGSGSGTGIGTPGDAGR